MLKLTTVAKSATSSGQFQAVSLCQLKTSYRRSFSKSPTSQAKTETGASQLSDAEVIRRNASIDTAINTLRDNRGAKKQRIRVGRGQACFIRLNVINYLSIPIYLEFAYFLFSFLFSFCFFSLLFLDLLTVRRVVVRTPQAVVSKAKAPELRACRIAK
jgi:hypothetical protein